jgi:hypothetical protein
MPERRRHTRSGLCHIRPIAAEEAVGAAVEATETMAARIRLALFCVVLACAGCAAAGAPPPQFAPPANGGGGNDGGGGGGGGMGGM